MGTIVTVEIVCAVFVILLLIGQYSELGNSESSRYLRLSAILVFLALIIDVLAYVCLNPVIPLAFRYFICLLAYSSGGIVALIFTQYSEAYFAEKTKLNPWVFRIPKIGEAVWVIATAAAFIAGKIIVYENGIEAADYGFPPAISVIQIAVLLYLPVIIILFRKEIGREAVFLLMFLNIAPLIGILASIIVSYDYTYVFATAALVLVTELLQRKQAETQREELEKQRLTQHERESASRIAAENNARFFALEDDFESLYDVNLESGQYVSYDRDEFYQKNISDKLVSATEFFKDLRTNVERVVYEEDRESVYNVQTREAIISGLSEKDHIDHYYRIITENGPMWLKMRIVYKDTEKKNVIVGIFNAEEEMAAKLHEEQFRAELEQTNARLFALEDNFESLYDVDIESGHYDVFVKGDFYRNNVLDKLSVARDYFEELRGNIDAVIYQEDKAGLYNTLTRESIREELADTDHFDYYYRLNTDNGPVWFKMRVVYKDAEKKNVIIGVFNASEDVEAKQVAEQKEQLEKEQQQLKESLTFTNFFLDTYISAYYVDFDTLSCQIYKRTEDLENDYPIITDYLESLTEYINRDVHPDDRKEMLEAVQPEKMKQTLEEKSEYSKIFRSVSGESERTLRMQVLRGAEQNHAAFGFVDITEEINEQNRRNSEAEEYRKLIESVAASYDVAFAVNLADDSYKLLKENSELLKNGEEFSTFSEAIASLLKIIHKSDMQRMADELNYDAIRNKLTKTKSYNVEFRVVIGNTTAWHEMNVTLIDQDRVAFGFAEKDVELTKLHLEEKRFNEYFALFVVDIDTEMLKVELNTEAYKKISVGESAPYTSTLLEFAETLDEVPREFFKEISNLDYVRRDLAYDDKRTFSYKSTHLEGGKWIDVTAYVILRHDDGTPAMFTLGFSIVDALTTARQELQSRMTENMQMIGGLAGGYDTLYYVNIDEGLFKPYSLEKQRAPGVEKLIAEGSDAFDILRRYGKSDMIHPDDRGIFTDISPETIREKLAHSKKYSVRFRRNYDGDYRWGEMDIVKYEAEDEQANAIAIGFADCDEQIRTEQEQQKQLEDALALAEAANKSKTDFLFNMSHDIRTPMNAITGFTNMAIKYIDDKDKVLDCLGKTQKAGTMLLSLINSVLEVSRIESGKASLEEQPGDIYYSFANIDKTMQEMADAKDIRLLFEFGEIRDRFVYADFSRCMRVFVNIISNAIKYTPEGGNVTVRCEQLGEADNGYGKYQYTFADNGIGMSEEFQKHVFEQFSREKTATVSGIQGTGLGMAVVKTFVELMGGTIGVKSKQGEGTTFTIVLPFRLQETETYIDPDSGEIISVKGRNENVEQTDFTGRKVLLVEDNMLNREIATDILTDEGLLVEDAEDGTVAVEKMKEKGPDYYDFILMDIQMPVMNGYEATMKIREMYPDKRIPIIALSANAFAEDREASRKAGMNDHVAKPINVKELFGILSKYI